MKSVFLCVILSLFLSLNTLACDTPQSKEYFFDDGSYIISYISSPPSSLPFLASTTTTKSKTSTYKTSSGRTIWSITVTGTFTYNGNNAKCTHSSISSKCTDSNWKLSNKSASKSGATATASAIAKKYTDGTYIKSVPITVTLTCSKTGKFS